MLEGLTAGDLADGLSMESPMFIFPVLLSFRLANRLPLFLRGGGLAVMHLLQGVKDTLAHKASLVAAIRELEMAFSGLPRGERYWLHTILKEGKSAGPDGTGASEAVGAAFEIYKVKLGFGRTGWVCKELLAYLQKYAFLRPRSTALLAMLHSRSIIWCRENRIPDAEFAKFQASTIGFSMRLTKEQAALTEELSTKRVGSAILQTMESGDFDEGVVPKVVNGYLMSPFWFMAPIFLSLARQRQRLWVARAMEGRGWSGHYDSSGRSLGVRLLDGIAATGERVSQVIPFHPPIPFNPLRLVKLVRWFGLEPGWELPVTKSKEYFT